MHPRSKHQGRYDFDKLISANPKLAHFVESSKTGDKTINFFNSVAVLELNKALLHVHYDIEHWDIPSDNLCPPIPGRVDYLLYLADLLKKENNGKMPYGEKIRALDIGTGANCIYPLIGAKELTWSFVGSEINDVSIKYATKNVAQNSLMHKIEIRKQDNQNLFFKSIIQPDEYYDLVMCNPPFHKSIEEANQINISKLSKIKGKEVKKPKLNFGGKTHELVYPGGEKVFVKKMMTESKLFSKQCYWYSTLISKKEHLKELISHCKSLSVQKYEVIEMGQGQKQSRFLAWTFLEPKIQKIWKDSRWY